MEHRTMLQLNQLPMGMLDKGKQPCTSPSCPKIGCDKHYSNAPKCHYGERVGNVKEVGTSKKKQYQCLMCSKSFAQSISLKRHVRTHTGEKPFECKDCNRRFTNSSHLTTHMRTHTGERPFQCDMCGKKFSQHSGLHVHIRTHTGDKPYKCELCGKGFLDRSALKRHGSTHLHNRDRAKPRKQPIQPKAKGKARVEQELGAPSLTDMDNLAALLCVKTLQEYLTTCGVTLLHPQQVFSQYALQRVTLHTIASSITRVKQEPRDVTMRDVTRDSVTSPNPTELTQSSVFSSPSAASGSSSPRDKESSQHVELMPRDVTAYSPTPSRDVTAYSPTLSRDVTAYSPTPSRDVTAYSPTSSRDVTAYSPTSSRDVSTSRADASSPESSLAGTIYQNVGSPSMPFICSVTTVQSFSEKAAEPDTLQNRMI